MRAPLQHLSYSNLSLFEQCPRCWYLRYVLGYQLPGSEAMELGLQVHEAIEAYHKNQGVIPPPSYLSTFVTAYSEMYKPDDFDFVEERWDVPILHPDEWGKPYTSQSRILMLDDQPLYLQVKMDRIWQERIHDVKTSSSPYKQEQIEGAHQTICYAYAYRMKFGKPEKGINYDVLIKNKVPRLQPMETQACDQDIVDTLRWIWETWEKILSYPNPEYHQPHCYNLAYLP